VLQICILNYFDYFKKSSKVKLMYDVANFINNIIFMAPFKIYEK